MEYQLPISSRLPIAAVYLYDTISIDNKVMDGHRAFSDEKELMLPQRLESGYK